MTVKELLDLINDMYPSATSDTVKVKYMNMAQDSLSHYFGLVATDETLTTTADDDDYALPTGIEDITQIEVLEIGNSATPSDRYDYSRYKIGYRDDKPMSQTCVYQGYTSAGVKSLIIYPIPTETGLPIRIRYKKKLPDLSMASLSTEPQFDSKHHDMLATFACYMICSTGASPDTMQANKFATDYEDAMNSLHWKDSTDKIKAPRKRRENRMWTERR